MGGAAVGNGMDQIEARNRAQIAAQLGRPLPPGGATVNDVVAMTHSGVNEELIVNQIRTGGVCASAAAGRNHRPATARREQPGDRHDADDTAGHGRGHWQCRSRPHRRPTTTRLRRPTGVIIQGPQLGLALR